MIPSKSITLLLVLLTVLLLVGNGISWWRRRRRRRCYRNCSVSGWSSWSSCSRSCGNSGTKTRTRYITVGAQCGGTCPYSLRQTIACNRRCCRVDCSYSWGGWTVCVGCGNNGRQSRSMIIRRHPVCGGTACPSTRIQTRRCTASR